MNIIKFNNSILKYDGKWLNADARPDYNPLNLPPNTVRVRTSDGNPPGWIPSTSYYDTATLVPGTTDVYDVYRSGTNLHAMFRSADTVIEVLGANITGVTDVNRMFQDCDNLTSVALFDTSTVTDMSYMFYQCSSLTNLPLFDTSNVTTMWYMCTYCTNLTSVPLLNTSNVTNIQAAFGDCYKVQSGALALYQQASSQANPPRYHIDAFYECGRDTISGSAELAQIPSDWK